MPRCFVALVLAGCWSSSSPSPPPPPPPQPAAPVAPDCVASAARVTEIAVAEVVRGGMAKGDTSEYRAQRVKLEPGIAKLCVDDAWSVELRTCLVKHPPLEVAEQCEARITEVQQEHLRALYDQAED